MKYIIIVTLLIATCLFGVVAVKHSGVYWYVFGSGDPPKGMFR